jgi:hypothetical protein
VISPFVNAREQRIFLVSPNLSRNFSYPFKKPGEISEVCVEQENALDSNFGNFLPQNIEMIPFFAHWHFV